MILPEGNKTTYEYSGAGDLLKVTDNDENSINYVYDAGGMRAGMQIKDAAGELQKVETYQYDVLSAVLKVVSVVFCFKIHRIINLDDKVFSETSSFLQSAGVKLPVSSLILSVST